jgi:hypothetical protein
VKLYSLSKIELKKMSAIVKNQYAGATRNNLFMKNDQAVISGRDELIYMTKPLNKKNTSTPKSPYELNISPARLLLLK